MSTTGAGGSVPAVLARGLWKRFGATTAVAGVDLYVPAGSFFGLVGPNGAGKTTTLSMLTGLLRPDAGSVLVDGVDVWQDQLETKRRIGVLPEGLRLFERLTGSELLTYVGRLRRLPGRLPAGTDHRRRLELGPDRVAAQGPGRPPPAAVRPGRCRRRQGPPLRLA